MAQNGISSAQSVILGLVVGPPTGAAVVGSVVVGDAVDWLGDSVRARSQSESFIRMSMKLLKPTSIATRSAYSLTPATVCPDRRGFEDV